jgi:hypothetical protein
MGPLKPLGPTCRCACVMSAGSIPVIHTSYTSAVSSAVSSKTASLALVTTSGTS